MADRINQLVAVDSAKDKAKIVLSHDKPDLADWLSEHCQADR